VTIHLDDLRQSIRQVGFALRRPEELAVKWRDRTAAGPPSPLIFLVLLANAIAGLAVYGLVMRLPDGVQKMIYGAVSAPLAAGLAWALALPALYITVLAGSLPEIQREDLSPALAQPACPHAPAGGSLQHKVELLERREIEAALAQHRGNRSHAADALGLSRQGLLRKMERYGLS